MLNSYIACSLLPYDVVLYFLYIQEFRMIVDHQDDLGTFLRQTNPKIANSSFIKEAAWKEKPEMMDKEFALILVEPNGTEHRKLAMQDAGNTLASITYLLTKDHGLTESAVKLASYNLLNAAMHQGLYDAYGDTLLRHEKLGSAFDILAQLSDTLSDVHIIDERRVGIPKEAMGPGMGYGKGINKTVATTQPGMPNMTKGPNTIMTSGTGAGMAGKTTYASYDLIKEAQFMWPELDPVDKRAFAMIIKQAAAEEGASVPNSIYQYTGNELNPNFEMIMKRRQDYTSNPELQSDYDRLSKVAHVMPLEDATEALYLLDEQAGLLNRYGNNIPDPVLSVYGTTKQASSWSWSHGGDHCTEEGLHKLCHDPIKREQFERLFSKDICDSFLVDPVKEFEKRPIEQQIIISRIASSTEM